MILVERTFLIFTLCRLVHGFTTGSLSTSRFEQRVGPLAAVSKDEETTLPSAAAGVTLKIAFDSQGGVADLSAMKSERFTCGESLDMVHRLRRVSDAVLVGRSTVEIDDCTLTVRRVPLGDNREQPTRIIVDPQLELQLDRFKIFQDGLSTILVHALADDVETSESGPKNVPFVETTNKDYPNVTFLGLRPTTEDGKQRLSTKEMCYVLANEFDIHHIMVEGGPNTALRFLKEGIVDRAILVYAPISFKEPLLSNMSTATLEQVGLEQIGSYSLGVDSLKCYSRPDTPWPSTDVSSWP